jgi:hypothetical protein
MLGVPFPIVRKALNESAYSASQIDLGHGGERELAARRTPTVVHYTTATVFVLNDQAIDGLNEGLSDAEVKALEKKYPDDFVKGDGTFSLPLVPVGTVVDITPEGATAETPKTPSAGSSRIKKRKK